MYNLDLPSCPSPNGRDISLFSQQIQELFIDDASTLPSPAQTQPTTTGFWDQLSTEITLDTMTIHLCFAKSNDCAYVFSLLNFSAAFATSCHVPGLLQCQRRQALSSSSQRPAPRGHSKLLTITHWALSPLLCCSLLTHASSR